MWLAKLTFILKEIRVLCFVSYICASDSLKSLIEAMEQAAQEYKFVIGKIGFLLMKSSGRSVQYVLLALGIEP